MPAATRTGLRQFTTPERSAPPTPPHTTHPHLPRRPGCRPVLTLLRTGHAFDVPPSCSLLRLSVSSVWLAFAAHLIYRYHRRAVDSYICAGMRLGFNPPLSCSAGWFGTLLPDSGLLPTRTGMVPFRARYGLLPTPHTTHRAHGR